MLVGYDLAKVAPEQQEEEEEEEATLCGVGANFVSGVCNAATTRARSEERRTPTRPSNYSKEKDHIC